MLAPLPAGREVTVLRSTKNGRDAYGNDTWSSTPVVYQGCAVFDGTSVEDDANRTTIITTCTALLPSEAIVTALDKVELDDGTVWAIDGDPGQPRSQITGAIGGVWVTLRKVTG